MKWENTFGNWYKLSINLLFRLKKYLPFKRLQINLKSMQKKILILLFLFTSCFVNQDKKKAEKAESEQVQLLFLALLANQCNPESGGFFFPDFFGEDYICLRTTLVHSGSKVNIYVQNGLENLQASYGFNKINYNAIASNFETIQNNLEPAIGKPSDINKDGKIDIVFFGFDSLSSGAFIAGFVDPIHFFVRGQLPSNQREVIFINGLELLDLKSTLAKENKPDPILATLAHEYQHLVRLPYQMSMSDRNSPLPIPKTETELASRLNFDDSWIDEGTSELASDIAGYGPQALRVYCFRGDPRYGCREGFNGRSLIDWNGSIINYSMAYMFMKYLYEVSASTIQGKNLFLYQTVTGSSSNRGKEAKTLSQVFISSAASYNSSILSSNSTEVFQRLYASFLALSLGYETNSTFSEDSTIRIGNSSPIGMYPIANAYPYPSQLTELMSFPTNITKLSASQFEFMPYRAYRVGGSRASGPYHENAVSVKRGKNGGPDPLDFLIFNGSLEKEKFITTKSSEPEFISLSQKPSFQLPISFAPIQVGAGEYLKKLTKYRLKQVIKN